MHVEEKDHEPLMGLMRMSRGFIEFIAASVRNPDLQQDYARLALKFANWYETAEIHKLRDIEPVYAAA
jgi:hypothetical protein